MCHTPSLTTAKTTIAALSNKPVNLYSDLALHHMGPTLADNVIQGAAGADEFRTAPLWGIGQRVYFLHDGRTNDLLQAIQLHASGGGVRPAVTTADATFSADASFGRWPGGGGTTTFAPSEANRVIAAFNSLGAGSQQDILNFLRSL